MALGASVAGDGPGATPGPAHLVAAYAAAVDRRDLEALRALFLPDATLTVTRGEGEPEVHRGHAGLAAVVEMLGQFEATLHEVSGLVVDLDKGDAGAAGPEAVAAGASAGGTADEARGESVCVAHHITRGEGRESSDLVLHGRYLDRFARDEHGAWRFAARELRVLWTEKRPVRL
jgi:ketosteroid isomerase-like protein